jgi:glycosyltransferase involved in cell wall biosynthesis
MSGATPRVSAIVPAYNAAAYLAEALDSALAQSYPSLEIIVVNDGSTDSTAAIADGYAAAFPGRVRVIHQPNAGLPGARNTAIAAARGELLALLDADDIWLPDHLDTVVAAFDAEPGLALVHANIERIDANGRTTERWNRRWRNRKDPYAAVATRLEHVSCPTVVFRRSCIEEIGGFDPQFTGLGCEDRDLWLRILERYPVRYIDHVTARYRTHGSNMSGNHRKMAAARQRLLDKLSQTPRGAPLTRHVAAMIESDFGAELQQDGQYRAAFRAQLRALSQRPHTRKVWRRVFGLTRAWMHSVLAPSVPLGDRS